MPRKHRAPTGSQEQQEPKKVAVDTEVCHSDEPIETCFCTTDWHDLRPTSSDG